MVFEKMMADLGLVPRPQQLELVSLARRAVHENAQRFVQAPTGSGKSYAVLAVALETARLLDRPSVVVCPNNTLIDQYIKKDAPRVGGVAGGRFVHIKGRSNYVCVNSRSLYGDGRRYDRLVAGGKYEWAELGLDDTYACPGSKKCNPKSTCQCGAFDRGDGAACECPKRCGIYAARADAESADVVITNAHVLVWNQLVLWMTGGNAALLPMRGALFVDECHELEGIGRDCMSDQIGAKSAIYNLVGGLREWVDKQTEEMLETNETERALLRDPDIERMVAEARLHKASLSAEFDFENASRLERFIDFATESAEYVSFISVMDPDKPELVRKCIDGRGTFSSILTGQPSVLVSGSIPSSDRRRLGVKKAPIDQLGHPFDYSKSTLIVSKYAPVGKADAVYRAQSLTRAINQTNGGTLVLFTSWADLDEVMPKVAAGLKPGIDVYVQSREDPTTLKQDVIDFADDGNAVLAGVRSLFTGLDIPGPALRQVVIWKLPYAVPTIEVKAIGKLFGRGVYSDQMMMTLVQGIGRLIRTKDDRGRVLIMDNRASKLDWNSNGMTHHLAEFGRA